MSTSMRQASGTLFTASPPEMRPRFTDGRANSGVDALVKGSDSMRRYSSSARNTALSPSHGVDPWAARPSTSISSMSTPFACTPTCISVGSPQITMSARRPSATSISDALRPGLARSSSGTITNSTVAPSGGRSCRSHTASIIAPSAPFMSYAPRPNNRSPSMRGRNWSGRPGTTSRCPWKMIFTGPFPARAMSTSRSS